MCLSTSLGYLKEVSWKHSYLKVNIQTVDCTFTGCGRTMKKTWMGEREMGPISISIYTKKKKKEERIKPTQIWHKRHKENPEKKIIWQVKHGIWMMVDRNHQNNGLFLWKNDWDLMEEVGIVQPQALFLICFKKTLILSVNLLCKFFFCFFLFFMYMYIRRYDSCKDGWEDIYIYRERERERDLRVEEVLEQPSSKHRDWSLG